MSIQAPPPETDTPTPGAAGQPEGYRAVLSNRNFLALWIGQIFSQVADRIIFVVFIALIVAYFGPSDRYNSYLYLAFTIPAIFLTAVAGVFVDRWPRRAVLVSTNLLRAACVALLPLAAYGAEWVIYGMAFLISCATQFFVPAEAATIPLIVRKTQLLTANSLFTTTMMASVIFGFALGDPLINIFSLDQVHWAITALFLLASVSLLFVKAPPPAVTATETPESAGHAFRAFLAEMQDGFHYIWEHRMVLNGMLKLAVLFSTVVAVCILFISFAKAFLYADPQVAARKFAYIITFSGIGMAGGAFLVGHFFQNARRAFMVFGGFLAVGLCLTLLTLISHISGKDHVLYTPAFVSGFVYIDEIHLTWRMVYTYALATVMGIGGAFIAIPLQSLLHELIPEDKRGKVLGVQFTVLSTCSTVPVLVAGLAVEWLGVEAMFLMIGVPLLLLGLVGLYHRMRMGDGLAANW